MSFADGGNACTILIFTADDGASVGQLVYDELHGKGLNVGLENLSKANAVCSVRRCTVFVPILSPQLEQSAIARAAFEEARRLRKSVVPVVAIKKWKPEDWLSLTIAGTTFFRIFDRDSAYKPFYDSNRITDLRVEVEVSVQQKARFKPALFFSLQVACRPVPSQAEREQAEIQATKEKIEECKKQLQTWPPPHKERQVNQMADREPVRVAIEPPSAKLLFTHIHYSITRMDMKAPLALLDEYGLPKRREIECMIR